MQVARDMTRHDVIQIHDWVIRLSILIGFNWIMFIVCFTCDIRLLGEWFLLFFDFFCSLFLNFCMCNVLHVHVLVKAVHGYVTFGN